MPIYEYYCPDNHTVYQFFAKTLAQRDRVPRCPDNPAYRMEKMVSGFAITKGAGGDSEPDPAAAPEGGEADDPRMEAAMAAMEREFSAVDENDPRAMGRMMRRMAELTGERLDGEMEEVVRKLEEGHDPDALEEQLGAAGMDDPDDAGAGGPGELGEGASALREARHRFRSRSRAPRRDPQLYDYD